MSKTYERPTIRIVTNPHVLKDRRGGFTLVEMLVSITIFVILAALAIGSFGGITKADRISAGTQQIKGWLEHAKSMAIHDKEMRGVRFQPDPNNPRLCTSVIYLGTSGIDQTNKTVELGNALASGSTQRQIVGVSHDGLSVTPIVLRSGSPEHYDEQPLCISQPTQDAWTQLFENGQLTTEAVLRHHLQINLLDQWIPITEVVPGVPMRIRLSRQPIPSRSLMEITPSGQTTGRMTPHALCGQALDYKLTIGPRALPDSDVLPRGVCIDLDASQLPWRPASGADPYAPIDLMYSPMGTLISTEGFGLLRFTVSTLEDAEMARINAAHPVNGGNAPYVLADPGTAQRVVSVIPNGVVGADDVNLAPGDATPGYQNDQATTPFN